MRLSIAAAATSLVLCALADVSRPIPPPPPGSACLGSPDNYPESDLAPIIVENQRRNLGITTLPRQWARDLLGYVGGRTEHAAEGGCRQLQCACVKAGKEIPYGFYKMSQCPLQHGASYQQCSVEHNGFQVRCVF